MGLFKAKLYKAKEVLELICSDLCEIHERPSDLDGFKDYLSEVGITSQLSTPAITLQNGVADRR